MADISAQVAAQVRTRQPSKKKEKPKWASPQLIDFDYGMVLAFDQAVAKTAWVLVSNSKFKGFVVLDHGMFKQPPVPDLSGFEDTLTRALWLSMQVQELIRLHPAVTIIHEIPAVGGYRIESSLLAALAIWISADVHGQRAHMVSAQSAKLLLTGNRSAEKSEVKQALLELLGEQPGRWNADLWDALALAVTSLKKEVS